MAQVRHDSEKLAALMKAGQDGDKRAYGRLLAEIAPIIRRVIRRERPFLDKEDVEDIVQDVLVSVHSVRQTYDPERPFLPWLIAIARNRMIDSGRRYVRRAAHEVRVEAPPVTFSDPDANFEKADYGDPEELRRAIGSLPAGHREAIELLKLKEMSLKEASAVSGSSIAALKVSVHRAVLTLRKTLKKE
jgi:RNA polymerase sigma-70 factor (ECF subfamily)